MISVQSELLAMMLKLSEVLQQNREVVQMKQLGLEMEEVMTEFRDVVKRVNRHLSKKDDWIREADTSDRKKPEIDRIDHDRMYKRINVIEKEMIEFQKKDGTDIRSGKDFEDSRALNRMQQLKQTRKDVLIILTAELDTCRRRMKHTVIA